jgi:hypothetical protein
LNCTTTHVILSQPIPPDEATSEATILSNISSITYDTFSFFFNCSPTKSTASYDVKQSHMPSHAIIRKAVSVESFSFLISGIAVII